MLRHFSVGKKLSLQQMMLLGQPETHMRKKTKKLNSYITYNNYLKMDQNLNIRAKL